MSSYVGAELRRLVIQRAKQLCEYCLIHESDTFLGCHVDHVISEKHGGVTVLENLAFACAFCNRAKGSDVGSITDNGSFCRFFNPRIDNWAEHFRLEGARIVPQTDLGNVTARILGFNHPKRVVERPLLMLDGRYPSRLALEKLNRPTDST